MRTSNIVLTVSEPFGKYELDIEAHATETFNLAGASAVGFAIQFIDSGVRRTAKLGESARATRVGVQPRE